MLRDEGPPESLTTAPLKEEELGSPRLPLLSYNLILFLIFHIFVLNFIHIPFSPLYSSIFIFKKKKKK